MRRAACGCIGRQQHQPTVLQPELHQRNRHRIHQGLQARLRHGLDEAVAHGGEKVGQQFGRNHGRSETFESWGWEKRPRNGRRLRSKPSCQHAGKSMSKRNKAAKPAANH
jgi:hypothetical protein